ncbi:hypothetical protein [Micromonospora sp. NPDC092111]|uniref:SWIM zinc finger family protein n=1 Tax=Micromonospora sp. NPDC092111 TaxID=3364289 RepID=UPI0037FD2399
MTARGFPAFPAGPARRVRSRWATGWVAALTDAALDPQPVRQGRRLAARGYVGPVTVSPGRVAASVHDGDPELAYRAVVRVEVLPDVDWDRLVAALTDRAGHRAALLAGRLPGELAEAAGVDLLPGPEHLAAGCGCPDWDHPCRHAAALCHQVSWLIDTDPLLLLLIRGRDPHALADAGPPDDAAPPGPVPPHPAPAGGDDAAGAYAAPVGPLPAPPGPPGVPDLPLLPPGPGVDPDALRALVAVAAARAAALLRGDPDQPAR